jgi:lysophospholipase L1-like esterase
MRLRHPLLLAVGVVTGAALAASLLLPPVGAAAGCGTHGTACRWLATLDREPDGGSPGRLSHPVVDEGISDMGFTRTPVAEIIAGYEDLIAAAHAAGLKIFGATLTPFQGSGCYCAAGEAEREAINHWIRTSGAFDGVIDFDQAVRDPADPLRLLPAYDSGDHLHPDDGGYQAMADAVNLALFQR